jgi:hypothetical protein
MRPRIAFNSGTSQKRREDAHALRKSGRLPDQTITAPWEVDVLRGYPPPKCLDSFPLFVRKRQFAPALCSADHP